VFDQGRQETWPLVPFCGFTGKLTAEHVFGNWLSRISLDLDANSSARKDEAAAWTKLTGADLLAMALVGHGSSKAALVEVRRRYSNLKDFHVPHTETDQGRRPRG